MVNFRQLKGTGNFYFVRHGQSIANTKKVIQGHLNSKLSELGEKQAVQAGRWFKDKNIHTVLTSPLDRARRTAELIAEEAGCSTVEVLPNLIEFNTGVFSGFSLEEAREKYPEDYRNFYLYSWEGVHGAENPQDIYKRALKHWQYLFKLFSTGSTNTVSVSHAGFIQWLIKATFGHRKWLPLFPMTNCGLFHFALENSFTVIKTENKEKHQSNTAEKPAEKETEIYTYKYGWKLINYHVGEFAPT
ncbi:MAG: histidine phosphatase family protein [Spirochaetales bacterium]|nr:histidine phosphatase family protein [Spirochaetales bacterium]